MLRRHRRRARRRPSRTRSGCSSASATRTGRISLAETVCLGYCHAGPAVRDGDVIDAGPGAIERAARRNASAARARARLREPPRGAGADPPRRLVRLHARARTSRPEHLLEAVKAAEVRGRGGAGFPAGMKWEFARKAKGERQGDRRQRRRGRPRLLHRQAADGAATRSCCSRASALAGYAVGADHGFVLVRSEYPRSKPALDAAIDEAREGARRAPRQHFDVTVVEGAGSYVVGEETALLALPAGPARHRLGAPAVPRRARRARHADRGQQRRDALQHPVHRAPAAPRPTARSAPTRPPARRSSASTSASPSPAPTRSRSG